MNKEMEEKVKNMSDGELNLFSLFIAYSLNNTMREINDDILKRPIAEHKSTSHIT
jgi:hypothetical protein